MRKIVTWIYFIYNFNFIKKLFYLKNFDWIILLLSFPPLYSFNFLNTFFIELFLLYNGVFLQILFLSFFYFLKFYLLIFLFLTPFFIQYFLPYHFVSPFIFHLSLTHFFKFLFNFFYSNPNPSYTKITIILCTPRCKIIHHQKSPIHFLNFHFLFFYSLWGLYYYFLNLLTYFKFYWEISPTFHFFKITF